MVITEFYRTREDGVNLYKSYSDEGYKIKQTQTNNIYNYAVDIEDSGFSYEETSEKIEEVEE